MKTLKLLILTLVVISLAGCKYKRENEQLQISNHELASKLAKSDSILKVNQMLIIDFETNLTKFCRVVKIRVSWPAGRN